MTLAYSNPIARELNDFWQETNALQQQWWYEADLDTKMATGQQDYWNMFYNINYRNQKQLIFNKILRILNMIGGYQRDNRLATIVKEADGALDNGEASDQLTTVLGWCMDQDQTYEKISDCFDGSNVCGLNLMRVWMDFREDPENGEIRTERMPFSSFILDNYWTQQDFSDVNRIWTRKYVTAKQLESLIPGIKKDIPFLSRGYAAKDGKFQFLAQNWYQYNNNMYSYDEYWVRDYKKVRKILDKSTGEVADWKGTRDQFQFFRRFNPNIELITAQVPTTRLHVLVNNQDIYEEKSPYGIDRFPFAPSICYMFQEVQNYAYRYQGIVRNIRDSQIELNKRRNRMLDVLDAQIQSGLHVKENALVNPEDAFFQGPGKVLFFKNTANLATDVNPIPPPPVAPGWLELIQSIEKELVDIVGPEELFGQNLSSKDMTGILMKLKQGAGLVGLRNIFDRLSLFQKHIGDIFIEMIQENFGVGKIAKILGKEPSAQFREGFVTKYSCRVDEGALTSSQRQMQMLDALNLKQLGVPISNKYILEKSTIQGKKELIEDIQRQEQEAAQLQQAQSLQDLRYGEMLNRSIEAKAQSDFSSAMEKRATALQKISLSKQESAKARQSIAAGSLDNIKALKELRDIDEGRLMTLANFVMDMQERQKALTSQEEKESLIESELLGASVRQAEAQTERRE